MKRILSYFSFLFLFIFFHGCSNKGDGHLIKEGQTIPILFNPNKFPPLDSFISDITVVPLETNDHCLIGRLIFQVKVHQGLFYINSLL